MKCQHCGAWTEVLETRKADRGHTLRRTRACGNECPKFVTYEVYGPIYRNDPARVLRTVHAAEARALRFRRNQAVLRDVANGLTHAEAGRRHGISDKMVAKLKMQTRKKERL